MTSEDKEIKRMFSNGLATKTIGLNIGQNEAYVNSRVVTMGLQRKSKVNEGIESYKRRAIEEHQELIHEREFAL